MSNVLNLFTMNYLFSVPVFGYALIYCVMGFAQAFDVTIKDVNKWKLWGLLTLFCFSIYFFYKNGMLASPGLQLLRELGSSVILGFLWAWIFLKVADTMGYKDLKPKKLFLVGIFGALAFGLFTLIRG